MNLRQRHGPQLSVLLLLIILVILNLVVVHQLRHSLGHLLGYLLGHLLVEVARALLELGVVNDGGTHLLERPGGVILLIIDRVGHEVV